MAAYICQLTHLVWSTKNRKQYIQQDIRERLFAYLGGIALSKKLTLIKVGGTTDHIHMLASLPATVSLAEAVNVLKSNSSKWIHQEFPEQKSFRWQSGYGAFSVSSSAQDQMAEYIERQLEHHRKRTFQEEFLELLKKHKMEYDERFVWE